MLQDPRCPAAKFGLLEAISRVGRKIGANQLVERWSRVSGNQRQRIHRGIECCLTVSGDVGQDMKCRGAGERMTGLRAIAGGSDLGGYQHGYDAPRSGQLEGSLQKGDGQIGRLAVAHTSAFPPAIPGSNLSPSARRDCFGAEPGWIADYQIEASLGENVGKRAAIVKPGNFLLAGQPPAGLT